MRRVIATITMMVLLGCSGPTDNDTSALDAAAGESLEPATATNPEPAEAPGSLSTERISVDDIEDAPPRSTLPSVCPDDSPIEPPQIGTVNTIVVPANAEHFDGAVVAVPDSACPGDVVSFVVSIVNASEEVQLFSAARGLIFSSGGMANWSLAPLSDLEVTVPPGDRLDQTVTGTIPPVAPGTYRVSPEGAHFFGEITVLDPASE